MLRNKSTGSNRRQVSIRKSDEFKIQISINHGEKKTHFPPNHN